MLSNQEFYTTFLLYKTNAKYFPNVTKQLTTKACNILSMVFKSSTSGPHINIIIGYLPVEYLLYLTYDVSYDISNDKLFYPLTIINNFIREISQSNWCHHCKTQHLNKEGLFGCEHKMAKYSLNKTTGNYWIGEQDQTNIYKKHNIYFSTLLLENKLENNKKACNKLFIEQFNLYVKIGSRLQELNREISWKIRKGGDWDGNYDMYALINRHFMIQFYWWSYSELNLITRQINTLQRLY